jgi:hypothetical protein
LSPTDFRNPIFVHYVHDMPQALIEAAGGKERS